MSILETIVEWDRELLIYLNSLHSASLDPAMYYASQTLVWLPLYLVILSTIVKDFKRDTWIVLAGIVITVLLADQVTSSLMKPFFERLRPSHDPSLEGIIHLVADGNGELYRGGLYGFASSHAANTFGTAVYFTLLLRHQRRWIYWLFLWAALMSYTRIYLGVHFPGDILAGALIGVLSGLAGYMAYKGIRRRREESEDERQELSR